MILIPLPSLFLPSFVTVLLFKKSIFIITAWTSSRIASSSRFRDEISQVETRRWACFFSSYISYSVSFNSIIFCCLSSKTGIKNGIDKWGVSNILFNRSLHILDVTKFQSELHTGGIFLWRQESDAKKEKKKIPEEDVHASFLPVVYFCPGFSSSLRERKVTSLNFSTQNRQRNNARPAPVSLRNWRNISLQKSFIWSKRRDPPLESWGRRTGQKQRWHQRKERKCQTRHNLWISLWISCCFSCDSHFKTFLLLLMMMIQ